MAESQLKIARVALATCAELPELDPESRDIKAALADHGVEGVATVWSDGLVDWSSFDLVVVRSCWDYFERREEFLAWADGVPRLANSSAMLNWNTDKTYLRSLAAKGIPTAPTEWIEPNSHWNLPSDGWWVIKPAVSLAALGTGSYDLADDAQHRLANAHVQRLLGQGQVVMLQPYLRAIDTIGETSIVFIGGEYSHAICKEALLDGPDRGLDRRFVPDGGQTLRAHAPSKAEALLADHVLDAVPGGRHSLLYARVDMTAGPEGSPCLMELELTEPHLYLSAGRAAERFAAMIARWAAARSPMQENQGIGRRAV